MPDKISVNCPVCDASVFEVKYTPWVDVSDPVKLYGAASGIPGTQTLVTCGGCGMIYENPRYPDDVILSGYTSSNEAGHDSQYPMRVDSFYRALKSMDSLLPGAGAKILDIGTAGGAFLDAAAKYGYDAFGLEPSAFLVERGKARGLKMEQGTIDSHPFAPATFDMVCLWDVLEHICHPKQALAAIRKLIKPGGTLLINYPDIGTWQAKLAGKRFWWILSVHLHHFSRGSVAKICELSGYEVFYFQRYWQTLQVGYLMKMAAHYKVPLSGFIHDATPQVIRSIPVPYYASQTTALARVAK